MSDARDREDGGLQAERTRLSWSRTALSLGAVGGLVVHTADGLTSSGAGLALIFLALVMYVTGVARYRGLARTAHAPGTVASPGSLLLVGVCTILTTAAALLVLFA